MITILLNYISYIALNTKSYTLSTSASIAIASSPSFIRIVLWILKLEDLEIAEIMDFTNDDMSTNPQDLVSITITHHGKPHIFSLPPTATITDLSDSISTTLSIPPQPPTPRTN